MLQYRRSDRATKGTQTEAEGAQKSLENERMTSVDETGLMTSSSITFKCLNKDLDTSKRVTQDLRSSPELCREKFQKLKKELKGTKVRMECEAGHYETN